MQTRARIQPWEFDEASAMRRLSPSSDWLVDRGFMGSLDTVAGKARRDRGLSAKWRLALGTQAGYTPWGMRASPKPEPDAEKAKLVKRLNRIRGQVDALQRALVAQGVSSTKLLQQATACRGAMDGFIAEVIEDHIREQVVEAETKGEASRAAEELIGLVHSYLT